MRRRVILSIASCAAILLLSVASYAAEKVGYINLQRLVNESDMGKAARSDIQKLRSEKEAVIRDKVQEINDLIDKKMSEIYCFSGRNGEFTKICYDKNNENIYLALQKIINSF